MFPPSQRINLDIEALSGISGYVHCESVVQNHGHVLI
jgi:hypothetical protein